MLTANIINKINYTRTYEKWIEV